MVNQNENRARAFGIPISLPIQGRDDAVNYMRELLEYSSKSRIFMDCGKRVELRAVVSDYRVRESSGSERVVQGDLVTEAFADIVFVRGEDLDDSEKLPHVRVVLKRNTRIPSESVIESVEPLAEDFNGGYINSLRVRVAAFFKK